MGRETFSSDAVSAPSEHSNTDRLPAVLFTVPDLVAGVYGERNLAGLREHLSLPETCVTRENWRDHLDLLHNARVVVSSWGGPELKGDLLDAMPSLELYLYGAGSIKGLMGEAAWDRGIRITSAAAANAVPVAEFALAQILFSLKHGWSMMRRSMAGEPSLWLMNKEVPGNYHSRAGVIGLSMIGKHLCRLLRPFDLHVSAFDPVADAAAFAEHGAERVDLESIFRNSDVVSLHAPWLPETEGMIHGEHFAMMKRGATFINTARGALVREEEMIGVLRARPDLTAVLDVTHPEPPAPDSPLFTLPNVFLTPHLAGSMGPECRRMGAFMAADLKRYLAGGPMLGEVRREAAAMLA